MMLRNNSLVLYGVPKLNFKINVIKIRVLNSFFMKSATNLGLFYSFLTNEIYPECLQSP